jgi:hypothetical protein
MDKHSRLLGLCIILFLVVGFAPPAQITPGPITLSVEAGFDGSFREDQWMPVYVRVSNDGDDVEGRLVVRPETSNNAVDNTYTLPISLPQGSRKAVFLYITARSFANQVRVELIDNAGVVVAAEPANLRSIEARDQLYVVVTQSAVGTTDLTGVHDAGYGGFQANWIVDNIPDKAVALSAVNTILFSDIDTGNLSTAQREAITDWVIQGGHLLVTGGTNWQATAAGLLDLLPLQPENSVTVDSLELISSWIRFVGPALSQQAVIATGTLQPGAAALISMPDDVPLVARRSMGNGTVDYLAFEPNAQPLRGWGGMTDFWLALASTVSSQPSWSNGIENWSDAASSANILPGVDLLPDILPLCGFLALYIALVGPLNYLILNRINRRELAWITIPLFIVLFSALAWVVGFNLRGNEVTLSRLTLVESWPDTDRAHVQEVLGLLSPRRAEYTLAAAEGSFFRSIPRLSQGTLLSGNVQVSTEIEQTDHFQANKFPVDASFIAAFNTNTVLEKPAIGGEATLFYDAGVDGQQIMRGSVRNDTDYILKDPVILVRGQAYRLEKPLAPGEIAAFDLTLPGGGLPSPSPISFAPGAFVSVYYRPYVSQLDVSQSIKDILGDQFTDQRGYYLRTVGTTVEEQETYRRRIFLSSFINDPYSVLTGRGNKAYLAAWTDVAPLGVTLEGANWKSLDTTLYLVELDVKQTLPSKEVLVSSDQFTWIVRSRNSVTDLAPIGMAMQQGDQVTFRFTPLPDAVLNEVNELTLIIDRGSIGARTFPIQLWNWENQEWDDLSITDGSVYPIRNPAEYLGPQNAVEVQVIADEIGNYARIQDLSIEQRGRF